MNSCPGKNNFMLSFFAIIFTTLFWGSWSLCGKTCGGGVRERTRSCTNPPPFRRGKGCGSDYHESKVCAVNKCPG